MGAAIFFLICISIYTLRLDITTLRLYGIMSVYLFIVCFLLSDVLFW